MRLAVAVTTMLLTLSGCNPKIPDPEVDVEKVWVQLPVLQGRPGAAYFTLVSNNNPTKLVNIASPRIERIELHDTMMQGDVTSMKPMGEIVFPDDLKLIFEPAGKHAMLFGIDSDVKAGDKIPLTFTFEPAPSVTVEAEVTGFAEDHEGE